jgi:site-specific DNA-methyltransferase (adenine-specific)
MLLLNGDCIEEMQKLIDDGVQVDSVVTDPPYHLTSIVKRFGKEDSAPAQFGTDGAYARASKGFMGKEWDGGDIAFRPETWELALKLLKPGGHLLAFSASRNYHRMAVAIEDAGFEIRDQMMWLYGSGFPKSQNMGKAIDKKQGNDREVLGTKITNVGMQGNNFKRGSKSGEVEVTKGDSEWEGWGTALKPAHEPIVMARKPLSESSIVDNVLKHGTGAINIDGCRVEGNDAKYPDTNPDFRDQGKKSKEAIGIDKLSFGQVQNAERTEKSVDTPEGRFPANVMHDGSDVITKEFPQTGKFGSVKPIDKQKTNDVFGKYNEVKEFQAYDDEGSAARFFYCPKTSKSERHSNLDDHETSVGANGNKWTDQDYRKGDTKPTTERKNTHPTVKPVELMKYLCRLVTPKGGTVLDPFMGSGSTGMAAKDEGFDFIGIEKEEEYFKICESRINRFAPLMDFM